MASLMRRWKQRWRTTVLHSGVHSGFGAQKCSTSSSPLPTDMACVPRRFMTRVSPPESCPSEERCFFPMQDDHLSFPPASYPRPSRTGLMETHHHPSPCLQPACASSWPKGEKAHLAQAPKKCTVRYRFIGTDEPTGKDQAAEEHSRIHTHHMFVKGGQAWPMLFKLYFCLV